MKNMCVTVGHLPIEISRPTKYLLDRGEIAFVKLTPTNYRVSQLIQGGLEIPCRIEILMAPTSKNKEIINVYKDLVNLHYNKHEKDSVVRSFLSMSEGIAPTNKRSSNSSDDRKSAAKIAVTVQSKKSDILSFFPITSIVINTDIKLDDIDMRIDKPILIDDLEKNISC